MFCQACGKEVLHGADFCVHCGASVQMRAQSVPAAAIELPSTENDGSQAPFKRLSAGTAFLLSLIIPAAGLFYCGKKKRALYTLLFWMGGMAMMIFASDFEEFEKLVGTGRIWFFVLYLFGFLDSYFTAREINSGLDVLVVDLENPRVAALLNLLTWGIGYFYVGQHAKGSALFLVGLISNRLVPVLPHWGMLVGFGLLVPMLAAWDAYRIAQAEIRRRIGTLLPGEEIRPESSRLPAVVPLAVAGCLVLALAALVFVGAMMGAGSTASAAPPAPAPYCAYLFGSLC